MFDPDLFLNTQTEEASSTEYPTVPDGEYTAIVDSLQARPAGDNTVLEVQWKIDAPGNEEADGRRVRQTIWLDLTESGALMTGKGKNVQLGRTRAAVGQNNSGQPWSPNMLVGQVATVKTEARIVNDRTYVDVKSVAPA